MKNESSATPRRLEEHITNGLVHTLDASKIAFDRDFGHLPGPIEQLGFMAAPADGAEVPNFLGWQGHHPTHFEPLV